MQNTLQKMKGVANRTPQFLHYLHIHLFKNAMSNTGDKNFVSILMKKK